MRSKTSSCDGGAAQARPVSAGVRFSPALFRTNLIRFWPLWALYAAVWLIALPVVQFAMLFGTGSRGGDLSALWGQAARELLEMGTSGGLWLGAFFGILFAMALFSYLYTPRAVGMFHSLPLRRESLFLTDYLTGAAVFLSTLALTALLTAAVQGAAGVPMGRSPLVFFACAAGQMFFFYSFACLCAFFTGQLLALPIFYIILNGVAMGLNLLVQNFASAFLYGYSGGGTPAWVSWLTPVWQLVRASAGGRRLGRGHKRHREPPGGGPILSGRLCRGGGSCLCWRPWCCAASAAARRRGTPWR
jgi:ABC-2 type transport system permease protein